MRVWWDSVVLDSGTLDSGWPWPKRFARVDVSVNISSLNFSHLFNKSIVNEIVSKAPSNLYQIFQHLAKYQYIHSPCPFTYTFLVYCFSILHERKTQCSRIFENV